MRWSTPLALKVSLGGDSGREMRRINLPGGAATRFEELLSVLGERFGRRICPRITYLDREGDVITISTDAELKEAFALGVANIEVVAQPDMQTQRHDDWEMISPLGAQPPGREDADRGSGIDWSSQLTFWLNGEEVVVTNPSPSLILLDWLREHKGMTGTHQGCGEGGCGICTVAMARKDLKTGRIELVPINSCLRRLCAVDGCHIVTSKGVGCQSDGFHEVQSAIAEGNGSQCGYCTPGWVMNMYALLEKNRTPSAEEVEQHFDGNLCRCTGYRPILTAFGAFAKGGKRCGKHQSIRHPPALLSHVVQPLHYIDEARQQEWYRPTSLDEYMAVVSQASGKRLKPVCANTADGVAKYYDAPGSDESGTAFVDISLIPELHGMEMGIGGLRCGAAVTIEKLIEMLEQGAADAPAFRVLAEHMKRIAAVQIRSVCSWAGNVMFTREHNNFPSDMVTILAAAGANFDVMMGTSSKVSTLTAPQLLDTSGTALLVSMTIPRLPPGTIFETYKVSQRHVFAHAIVNFGACIALDKVSQKVTDARIVLGGATNKLLIASRTVAALKGCKMDNATFQAAVSALRQDITTDVCKDERHSTEYRNQLAVGFLYKAFLAAASTLPAELKTATLPFVPADARPVSRGTETFDVQAKDAPIGQYVVKRSAFIQASGEATYPSDVGGQEALFGQLVISTTANAKLLAMDPTAALAMPGVHDFITGSAVPGLNCPNGSLGGDNLKEKLIFEVGDVIPCVGAVLGVILADTSGQARLAAKKVVQQYKSAGAVVVGIDKAMQLSAIAPPPQPGRAPTSHRRRGARPEFAAGVELVAASPTQKDGLLSAKAVLRTGAQSHFYMETQSACAIPFDGQQWEVYVSDQDSNFTQASLALILGVPQHHINVKVPRAGGAFGGKLLRQCINAGAAAVAANAVRRPVRIQNERSDDMQMFGGREVIHFDYDATFDTVGVLDSMDMTMTIDPGWFYGDAEGDMTMAVGWSDNCYRFKNFKVTPKAAVTTTAHTTPMRAPGCLQSILAAEVVMEHVAKVVGKPLDELRELNFYKLGDTTPFNDTIGKEGYNWTIPTLWSQIQNDAKYAERKKAIEDYNAQNRWTKKGIAMSPVKYVMGIDFYSSGALVNIYADGTVLVSTGGCEVGQGLNVKVALCVASTLGAPLEKVRVGARETDKVPDNTGTGGSGTSECTSEAAMMACRKLLDLLAPYRTEQTTWEAAVAAAAKANVGLMASGWYQYKKDDNQCAYSTYGTAISEVLVDGITGEVRVERVDVLMDLGNQLDAAIDIGQVQGGFMMALGYLLTEEQKFDESARQLNLGTWEYKIPSAYDIPLEFNVALLKDSPNPVGVKGSKASAEPSMCLIPSVYLAVKNALYALRKSNGLGDDWFMLDTPLTPERVAIAAGTRVSSLVVPS